MILNTFIHIIIRYVFLKHYIIIKFFFYISALFNNIPWYYNLFARYQLWNLRNNIAFIKKAKCWKFKFAIQKLKVDIQLGYKKGKTYI